MKTNVLIIAAVIGLTTVRLQAQTVLQLPSFHVFATDSSVLVPDRGTAVLGGVNGASSGRSQFGGLPGNKSIGLARGASGVTISAQVHDFEAHDKALLAQARRERSTNAEPQAVVGDERKQGVCHDYPGRKPAESWAIDWNQLEEDGRTRQLEAEELAADEARRFSAQADKALAAGKPGVARIYLQMAARRTTGEPHERALTAAAALGSVKAAGDHKPRQARNGLAAKRPLAK